ncbi:MAG: hypothetical protein R2941_10390 [Desulfobacterales bacterium]
MKCPNCGEEKLNIRPGTNKCSDCYYIFEISEKDANQFKNSKIFKLNFGLAILLPEVLYIIFAFNYDVNEFKRPYFHFTPLVIAISCICFIIYFMLVYKKTIAESLIVGSIVGLYIGLVEQVYCFHAITSLNQK